MSLELFMINFTAAFTGLFVIMDPFVSIPVLLGVSKGEPEDVMRKSADQAVAVAGGLIFVFIFFGVLILDSLDITIDALKVGSGSSWSWDSRGPRTMRGRTRTRTPRQSSSGRRSSPALACSRPPSCTSQNTGTS
jgi:small neutral amino acid transporter SnatA (MarC family)